MIKKKSHIQWYEGKPDLKRKPWFAVFANFHDVNIYTMAIFKLQMFEQPVHKISEYCI